MKNFFIVFRHNFSSACFLFNLKSQKFYGLKNISSPNVNTDAMPEIFIRV